MVTTSVIAMFTAVAGGLATWIFHRMYPVKAAVPPAPSGPSTGLNLAAPVQAAGLTWLVPLFKALETFNAPLIQTEARFVHRLIEQQGGVAKLISDSLDQLLESRLAAGRAKYLMQLAADAGITPRELLDAIEGKPEASPAQTVPAPAVATAVLALLFCLFSFGSTQAADFSTSHWNADVRAPAVFYPTEIILPVDPFVRDCPLPDKGPTIYVDYYFADWCTDCAESSLLADNLRSKGYDVLKVNASLEHGAKMARARKITTVPFWIVMEDGREIIRGNDSKKVLAYLNAKQPKSSDVSFHQDGSCIWPAKLGAVYGPDGSAGYVNYQQPAYYQNQRYGVFQGNWYPGKIITAPFRAVARWRPLRRLFGRC